MSEIPNIAQKTPFAVEVEEGKTSGAKYKF